ncbi:MAG: methyltransferase domain-containing protein [Campylobacterales bacterium]|nr:methyltransferase domain-containing protein [Campylobacterales bacterium]
MLDIISILQKKVAIYKEDEEISFDVIDPDLYEGYAGCLVSIDGQNYIYRGYKAWADLAQLLMCKMLTPRQSVYPLVKIRFKKLLREDSFHLQTNRPKEEKYGTDSLFFGIHKMEEPAFLYYYRQALQNVDIQNKKRILDLGINKADEFETIRQIVDSQTYQHMILVGIDHSQTALTHAQNSFPESNVQFHAHNINDLDTLDLGKFDLLISIGTLQSPGINFKPFFMSLIQNYLTEDGSVILGFPNSRWIGGEMIYGAKAPNYAMSEMSLLFNDVMFCKKYLQQHKFRVTITGKEYIFLTATKITKRS